MINQNAMILRHTRTYVYVDYDDMGGRMRQRCPQGDAEYEADFVQFTVLRMAK